MTIEPSTSKPTVTVFPAGVVLTIMALITRAANSPILAVDFNLGCSFVAGMLVGWPGSKASTDCSPAGW
jgi:hypothetical protein